MASTQPNHRASLLSGLRTGGVRSVSVPHTAAPTGSFNVQRVASNSVHHSNMFLSEGEETDQLSDFPQQRAFTPRHISSMYQPQTAGLDGAEARFSLQQQGNFRSTQYLPHTAIDNYVTLQQQQAADHSQMQMQLMQMEIMRIQALAQMQHIANMQAEAARPKTLLQGLRSENNEPATAGPAAQSFGQVLHGHNIRQLPAMTDHNAYDNVPMTAALGGRFGGRHQPEAVHSSPNYVYPLPSRSAHSTAGGGMTQSKSDSAVSWRRGSTTETTDSQSKSTMRAVKSATRSPPTSDSERASSPEEQPSLKSRPKPLLLSSTFTANTQAVSSAEESEPGDDSSSSKSDEQGSSSLPTTPLSGNSQASSLSAREEASKKLFQGLGIGRPSIHVTAPAEALPVPPIRSASQVVRQPRGPPSSSDEFRDKNFANRIRKMAIGGLGVLMEAREKRDIIQDVEV